MSYKNSILILTLLTAVFISTNATAAADKCEIKLTIENSYNGDRTTVKLLSVEAYLYTRSKDRDDYNPNQAYSKKIYPKDYTLKKNKSKTYTFKLSRKFKGGRYPVLISYKFSRLNGKKTYTNTKTAEVNCKQKTQVRYKKITLGS